MFRSLLRLQAFTLKITAWLFALKIGNLELEAHSN